MAIDEVQKSPFLLDEVHRQIKKNPHFQFSYFATHDVKIDLVIERLGLPLLFVEFKSASLVREQELRGLQALVSEVKSSAGIYSLSGEATTESG